MLRSQVCSIVNGELSYRTVIQFDQEMPVEPNGVDPLNAVTTPREEGPPKGNEPRADARAKGLVEGGSEGASGQHAVRITGISERGCFVESLAWLPPGERVRLKLVLPEAGEISVTGEVITVEPNVGFAIQFVELTAQQRTALQQTVSLSRNCDLTPTTVAAIEPNSPDAAREDELAVVQVRNDW